VELQRDLENLEHWSKLWCMNFSAPKCTVVSVTRKRKRLIYDYKLNNIVLEHVSSMKDLGVLLNSDLTWSNHIDSIISKSNKTMGMIIRSCGYSVEPSIFHKLYNTLARCKVEYCTPAWNAQTKRNLKLIEGTQRRATKFIEHTRNCTIDSGSPLNYKQRLEKYHSLPLSYRREILDLKFFHKCLIGQIDLDVTLFITFANNNTRTGNDTLLLVQPKFKTETFAHSYFVRIVTLWNQLSLPVRSVGDPYIFGKELQSFYRDKFLNYFDCDNECTWVTKCRCPKCRPCF